MITDIATLKTNKKSAVIVTFGCILVYFVPEKVEYASISGRHT